MSSTLSIAASGMAAASQRLAVSARNVANASGAAAPLRVDQVEVAGGGTQASTSAPPSPPVSAGMAMLAQEIDLASEAVDQLLAQIAFAANAQVMRASRNMTKSLIDIMA